MSNWFFATKKVSKEEFMEEYPGDEKERSLKTALKLAKSMNDDEAVTELVNQIALWHSPCCPLCQEVACDEGCEFQTKRKNNEH